MWYEHPEGLNKVTNFAPNSYNHKYTSSQMHVLRYVEN